MSASPADWHALLDTLMPFHLRVDRTLKVSHAGPLLRRIAPDLADGTPLLDRFEMQPTVAQPGFDSVAASLTGRLTILRLDQPFVQLRGCFVAMPGGDELLFAGSLWVTDLTELGELGLAGSMLPPNDPLVDLLMTHRLMMTAQQSSQRAMTAARDAESKRQIETLEEVNRRLETAVRERTAELEKANAELTRLLRAMPR